jgi:hypothetical protein
VGIGKTSFPTSYLPLATSHSLQYPLCSINLPLDNSTPPLDCYSWKPAIVLAIFVLSINYIVQFAVMLMIASATMVACKKDNDKPSNSAIEGKWVGKYGFDSETPSVFYSFQIKAGGILEEYGESGMKIAQGTWKLENNVFTGTTFSLLGSNNQYSVIAAYNAAKGELLGDWGYDESVTDGGTWTMKKQ